MFDLAPHPSSPIKRTRTAVNYQLGLEKWLPPALEAERENYLVELTSENDPANAKSWPLSRKLRTAGVLGFDTLVASLLDPPVETN